MVDDEIDYEVDGWLADEPGGRHVEEDGALVVGRVEGCEYICGGWRVEFRGVDIVDLDRVVCAIFEEGGIPSPARC